MKIRPAERADLPWLCDFHKGIFHPMLSAKLGSGFLERYYGCLLAGAGFIAVAEENRTPMGMIAGAWDFHVLQSRTKAAALGALAIRSWKPSIWMEGPRILRRMRFEKTISIPAQLVTLGVEERFQGRGLGRALVEHLEDTFRENSVERYYVMTTDRSRWTATSFYKHLGFEEFGRIDLSGYEQVYLAKNLPPRIA